MTCYTVLSLLKKFNLNEESTMVKIGENAANIAGTSAELELGHTLSV
jgi:D-alanyl-D-alanine carboxypeptidase